MPNPHVNGATTFANIPSFVPHGVLWYAADTGIMYVGTGISNNSTPGVVQLGDFISVPNQKAVSYTLLSSDYFVQFNDTGGVAVATLNSALAVGTTYRIKNISAQSLTVKSTAGNIDSTAGSTGVSVAQWASLDVTLDQSRNWNIL
jgi:hypothetical protein